MIRRAFTLIEVLIVVCIFAIILALMLGHSTPKAITPGIVAHKYYRAASTPGHLDPRPAWILVIDTFGSTVEHEVDFQTYTATNLGTTWPTAEKAQ